MTATRAPKILRRTTRGGSFLSGWLRVVQVAISVLGSRPKERNKLLGFRCARRGAERIEAS